MSSWIEVDRAGLAQVIADRPKSFILFELIQNALDEDVTKVTVTVEPEGHGVHRVTVEDDSPDGYQDIRHAWTLYAPSKKKGDPSKRGRFNSGCKMVLALAKQATIVSTQSAVEFCATHGRRLLRRRREKGTEFSASFRMTKDEAAEAISACQMVILPESVDLFVNGDQQNNERRECLGEFECVLPTIASDSEGALRRTSRKTSAELWKLGQGEAPRLFEMGIPVVELDGDDPYHINVMQRVPLNQDRDNVTPAYLRTLRVEVLNNASDYLTQEQARATWATEASEDERAESKAVEKVLTHRFGEKRVAFDPTDPEANKRAAAAGYTVIPGGSMTRGQWANTKRDGHAPPAGQVTPGHRVETSPDGVPPIPPDEWTQDMREVSQWATALWSRISGGSLDVSWFSNVRLPFAATWGQGGYLSINRAKVGAAMSAWREGVRNPILALIIHEFAHERESDHLSDRFHAECCRIGAMLALFEGGI